ncbi:DUF806 family protein [Lactococcus piscium]|uniref:DUF806 family protein n=1 Tax=Pseudolactococcus paracarnosus TaxID=2749962 RepID=UPI001FBAAAD7|nr:DUF806 family protein [Lactococcus paracarnosus]MCJ1993801.1 DUF806 family protein [Lactococcus paracarnosus]
MRPVEEVSNIAKSFRPKWGVFIDSIPAEKLKDLENTQVLVREEKSDVSNYGDGTFSSVILGVSIQIFYGFNFEESMLFVEVDLMTIFIKNGWKITSSEPHYLDISTNTDQQQTVKNITVEKTVNLNDLKGE